MLCGGGGSGPAAGNTIDPPLAVDAETPHLLGLGVPRERQRFHLLLQLLGRQLQQLPRHRGLWGGVKVLQCASRRSVCMESSSWGGVAAGSGWQNYGRRKPMASTLNAYGLTPAADQWGRGCGGTPGWWAEIVAEAMW